ncbi:2-deoxyglucose-6-phosphatase [Datura stramonium]|uniref:2-deoxyglucose-6-phosphatase n=1 Tax=Datura stramonium TaxID=4076 RepID=A0ABS8RH81_DATST|nr:2-deoxyglucose-6-phosphatase [Datura stramonium]
MATSNNTDRKEEESLQCAWKNLQHEELAELEYAAAQVKKGQKEEPQLSQLVQKIVKHFQEHSDKRIRQARNDASPFFAPASFSTLEKSVLWIAGCRPSSFIRLIYALSGIEPGSHMTQFLEAIKTGELRELKGKQLSMIDELQGVTIREERRISTRLASLQEDMVDQQFSGKMKKKTDCDKDDECENADETLDEHSQHMAGVMEEADKLRMKTLKEIVLTILDPIQAVEYLAAAKKISFALFRSSVVVVMIRIIKD